jgi:anti-sigma regulatory factor (Ser/Thr protein kinase)
LRLLSHLPIAERSQTSEARRIAVQFAQKLGFNDSQAGEVAVVATELANNLVTHAQHGEILLSTFDKRLDLLSIDRGPGMNIEACLRDGFSTAGTAGTGLGAIKRLSKEFDAYSQTSGTILVASFGNTGSRLGVARTPKKGETVCGDSWSVVQRPSGTWILLADGLGHGEFAAQAADMAVESFENSRFDTVTGVVKDIHAALRSSRGAAIAVTRLENGKADFCGLGNIAAQLHTGQGSSIHMVSMSGTAGIEARKINPFSYTYPPGSALIMNSDGIQTQWSLERYPGILRHHPSIVAGSLYRDYSRGRDDVTVLVFRT